MSIERETTARITGGRCNDFVRYPVAFCYRFLALTPEARKHIGELDHWDVRPENVEAVQARMIACGLTVA